MLWQKILVLTYNMVLFHLNFSYVFCMHFPKLIHLKKYKDRLSTIIIYLSFLNFGITGIPVFRDILEQTNQRCDISSLKTR